MLVAKIGACAQIVMGIWCMSVLAGSECRAVTFAEGRTNFIIFNQKIELRSILNTKLIIKILR